MTDLIRIVLVDDHEIVREGLRTLLSEEDEFDIVGEAENGLQAIDVCASLQPDVVLMDLMMPEMNGFDVAAVYGVVTVVAEQTEKIGRGIFERDFQCQFLQCLDAHLREVLQFAAGIGSGIFDRVVHVHVLVAEFLLRGAPDRPNEVLGGERVAVGPACLGV